MGILECAEEEEDEEVNDNVDADVDDRGSSDWTGGRNADCRLCLNAWCSSYRASAIPQPPPVAVELLLEPALRVEDALAVAEEEEEVVPSLLLTTSSLGRLTPGAWF